MLHNHDLIRQLIREVLSEERGPVSQTVAIGSVGSTFRPVAAPGLGKIVIASAFAKAYGWIADYTGVGCIMANPNYPCTKSHPIFEIHKGTAPVAGAAGSTPQVGSFNAGQYTTALQDDTADLTAAYAAASNSTMFWTAKVDFSAIDLGNQDAIAREVGIMLGKTCVPGSDRPAADMKRMILAETNKRSDFKAFLLKFIESAHNDFISYTNGHSSSFRLSADKAISGLSTTIKSQQTAENTAYATAKREIINNLR